MEEEKMSKFIQELEMKPWSLGVEESNYEFKKALDTL